MIHVIINGDGFSIMYFPVLLKRMKDGTFQ